MRPNPAYAEAKAAAEAGNDGVPKILDADAQ